MNTEDFFKHFIGLPQLSVIRENTKGEEGVHFSEMLQAFGYADIGYGPEAGYISIEELLENDVELDLYWTPRPWGEVKKAAAA